jgi:hypothetical protein
MMMAPMTLPIIGLPPLDVRHTGDAGLRVRVACVVPFCFVQSVATSEPLTRSVPRPAVPDTSTRFPQIGQRHALMRVEATAQTSEIPPNGYGTTSAIPP